MKKKGEAGYISSRKKQVILKTILEFGIVIALLVLGILQTGDRMNLLTVVAVVGCLPAAKAMVEMIMILPHRSVSEKTASEIDSHAAHLTRIYDMVFTSEKKVMPVDSVVIFNNTVCGYTSNSKVEKEVAGQHIKQYLHANQFTKVTVKIFHDYATFLTRLDEMNQLATGKNHESGNTEEGIRRVILNISL